MTRLYSLFLTLGSVLLLCSTPKDSKAQGVSFSYFFPDGGYFSAPVAPVAIRGLGLNFGDHVNLSTGISWYRIMGMQVDNIPLKPRKPLMGPIDNFLVPLELRFIIPIDQVEFKVGGGIFTYYNANISLNRANMDRALMDKTGWPVLNSRMKYDNNWGFGYIGGLTFTYYVRENIGLKLGANYLMGGSDLNLRGTYTGVPENGSDIERVSVKYPDSRLDFTGLETSIGVVIKND